MRKSYRSEQGSVHLLPILIVVVVAIAGVGYMVYSRQKKSDNTANSNSTSTVINKEAEAACNKLYDDKDLCKFASGFDFSNASYKATYTTTADGKTSTMEMEQDSKGNSSFITKEGGAEIGAYVSLDGNTYMKDPADGSWTKYPKAATTDQTDETDPADDLDIDFSEEEAKPETQRITYKKLGKEKCGNANCFKYQMIDPAQPADESIVWFGDKDYVLRKWSFKGADGSTSVGEFSFVNVTIKAPSPVKDAPAQPTEAEIQSQIDAAIQASGE